MKHFSLEHFVEHKLLTLEGVKPSNHNWLKVVKKSDSSWMKVFFSLLPRRRSKQANWNEIEGGEKFYVRQQDWREKSSGQKASSFQVFSQSEETEWGVCIWGISNHRSHAKLSSQQLNICHLTRRKKFFCKIQYYIDVFFFINFLVRLTNIFFSKNYP